MGVFEEYKKQQSPKMSLDKNIEASVEKEAKKVWQKDKDGSICLTQELNEEMVKSFFSSARHAFAGIVIDSLEEDTKIIEDENEIAEEVYEMRVAMHEPRLAEYFDNLNEQFEDTGCCDKDSDDFDMLDFDDNGLITKGISAKRYVENEQTIIEVWVFNNGIEDEARFVGADIDDIKEWIDTIF